MRSVGQWMKSPKNVKRYQAWVDREDTKEILELVRQSVEPVGIPLSVGDKDKVALMAYGEMVGAFAVLRRLLNLEAEQEVMDTPVDKYMAARILKEQFGMTESEITVMLERIKEA